VPSNAERRDDRDVSEALSDAADGVLAAVSVVASPAPIVLIDGRSGSGKSSLAASLVARWNGTPQLVALDDLYPGWDGLRAGVDEALRRILRPHAAHERSRWRRWDWETARWDRRDRVIEPDRALIVEGAGLLTARTAPLGDVRVWLESPQRSRRRRALDRDGDAYRPHWDRWAVQEEEHIAVHAPASRATLRFEIP